jgi:hypothetical protein
MHYSLERAIKVSDGNQQQRHYQVCLKQLFPPRRLL